MVNEFNHYMEMLIARRTKTLAAPPAAAPAAAVSGARAIFHGRGRAAAPAAVPASTAAPAAMRPAASSEVATHRDADRDITSKLERARAAMSAQRASRQQAAASTAPRVEVPPHTEVPAVTGEAREEDSMAAATPAREAVEGRRGGSAHGAHGTDMQGVSQGAGAVSMLEDSAYAQHGYGHSMTANTFTSTSTSTTLGSRRPQVSAIELSADGERHLPSCQPHVHMLHRPAVCASSYLLASGSCEL